MERLPPEAQSIIQGDCLEVLAQWPDGCIDHCVADPPFGIASGRGRQTKAGLGWAFSSHVTMQESWDRFTADEFAEFNRKWLAEVSRVVKPNGNIFVFGTYHNIYELGYVLHNVLKRRVVNSIVWYKPNAQPNITARMLAESTEQIIWCVNETPKRAKNWTFNYWLAKELNGGKQMRNLWDFTVTPKKERLGGGHPSQKPLALLERIVAIGSRPGEVILDLFAGAGTTSVAAKNSGRKWVLVEADPKYIDIARQRLAEDAISAPGSVPRGRISVRTRQPRLA